MIMGIFISQNAVLLKFLGYIKLVVREALLNRIYCRICSSSGNIKHVRNHIGHYPVKEAERTVNPLLS